MHGKNKISILNKYEIEYSNGEVKIIFKISDITSEDMKHILSSVPDNFIMDSSDLVFDVLYFRKKAT